MCFCFVSLVVLGQHLAKQPPPLALRTPPCLPHLLFSRCPLVCFASTRFRTLMLCGACCALSRGKVDYFSVGKACLIAHIDKGLSRWPEGRQHQLLRSPQMNLVPLRKSFRFWKNSCRRTIVVRQAYFNERVIAAVVTVALYMVNVHTGQNWYSYSALKSRSANTLACGTCRRLHLPADFVATEIMTNFS